MVIPSGAVTGGGMPMGEVNATHKLQEQARVFKYVIIGCGASLVPLLFLGNFWMIFQLIFLAVGYYAVADPLVYKSALMQLCFVAAVFGAAFTYIDVLLTLSILIPSRQASLWLPLLLWSLAAGTLTAVSLMSWRLYKEMLQAPTPALSLQPALYTEPAAAAQQPVQISAPASGGFVPFSGQGHRLGG